MNTITDYTKYNSGMAKSIQDKLFFIDRVNPTRFDTVIDFGCANGKFLHHLRNIYPTKRLIGYDIDETMLHLAHDVEPTAELFSDWDMIPFDPSRTLLNLSSVIHEVYSYSTDEEIALFWERVNNSGFAYVCVRDMMIDGNNPFVRKDWRYAIEHNGKANLLADFERVWGKVSHRKSMLHFLLKYRYTENWGREVRENYLPITTKTLLENTNNYQVQFSEHFSLPFLISKVNEEFGIDISGINTHLKLILTGKF